MTNRIMPFFCPACRENITKISDLIRRVSDLEVEINNNFTETKGKLVLLEQRILKMEQQSLKDLKLEMEELKSSRPSQTPIQTDIQNNSSYNEIIEELNERNKRKNNLIIFGINEHDQSQTLEARKNADRMAVVNLIQAIQPDVQSQVTDIIRLGRFVNGRSRPLKVILRSENDVHQIIRNAKKLRNYEEFKGVSVSFDRTRRQLDQYKLMKTELMDRHSKGDTNCKIKYIGGVPKIVSNVLN